MIPDKISVLKIFILLILVSAGLATVPDESRKNETGIPVILITIETTRADHIGPCYGHERLTAENICELAEDGVLFKKAFSQGTSTSVSVPSMLSSRPPISSSYSSTIGPQGHPKRVNPERTTLIDVLNKKDYITIGVSKGIRLKGLSESLDRIYRGQRDPNIEKIKEILNKEGKIFIWFFPNHPHIPYRPKQKFRKWDELNLTRNEIRDLTVSRYGKKKLDRKEIISLYDAEINSADSYVGNVIDLLKRKKIYRESLIIVTSDHGEAFIGANRSSTQHLPRVGWHGGEPTVGKTHVPLIVKYPQNRYEGIEIDESVRLLEIAPTIYNVLEIEPDHRVTGYQLKRIVNEEIYPIIYSSSGNITSDWSIFSKKQKITLMNINSTCLEGKEAIISVEPIRFKVETGGSDPGVKEICNIYSKGWKNRLKPSKNTEKLSDKKIEEILERMGYVGRGA